MSAPTPASFGPPATILRVTDVRASVAHYVNALGFTVDWDEGYFASVTRGRCTLFLTDTANFRNPHYHRPSDTPETLDYERMAKVVKGVHQAVLDYGARWTGATVHIVDEEYDTGPIVLQEAIEVRDDQFAYELRRPPIPGGRFFRVEFDLSRPVPAPPPPWGASP